MGPAQQRWVLSGGLASGKSKVREYLEAGGISTIDADRIGHMVLEPGGRAFSDVAARWPQVVREGKIDRTALASVVFSDRGELAELEMVTHPHIFDTIRTRVEEVESIVVVEIPVLGHGLGDEWQIMIVDCRDDLRLERALARGMSKDDATSRMSAQPGREEWLAAANLVIPNHQSESDLERGVAELLASDAFSRSRARSRHEPLDP